MGTRIYHTELEGFLDAAESLGIGPGYFLVTSHVPSERFLFYVMAFFRGRDHTDHFLKAVIDRQGLQVLADKGFVRVERIVP